MAQVIALVQLVVAHYQEVLAAVTAILTGFIAISVLIPGDQPEKFLQSVVDFISRFSRK